MGSAKFKSRRMILRPVLDEQVILTFAERVGLPELGEPGDFGDTTGRAWTLDEGLELHYGWNARSGRGFLQVLGDDQGDVDEIADIVDEHFHPLSYDQLLQQFRDADSPHSRAQATLEIAVGQPAEFDKAFLDCVLDALGDLNAEVRAAGVYAAAGRLTADFVPILQVMVAGDPDDDVRDAAQTLLEICQEAGLV